MLADPSAIAVVPARGGSKRIPRKNIRPFLGVPLMQRTLEMLLASELFEAVVVSTDDSEIAALAEAIGAQVPFKRPAALSDDSTGTTAVIGHAVDWLIKAGRQFGDVLCIYPGAVFTTAEDLMLARGRLTEERDYVVSATTFDASPWRALRAEDDGSCRMQWPEFEMTRTQDLDELFHDAGQFYWGHAEAWSAQRGLFSGRSALHLLPRHRVQDIDTPEDWQRAELAYRMLAS